MHSSGDFFSFVDEMFFLIELSYLSNQIIFRSLCWFLIQAELDQAQLVQAEPLLAQSIQAQLIQAQPIQAQPYHTKPETSVQVKPGQTHVNYS